MLELAGVTRPESTQGKSLLPLRNGETPADWRPDSCYAHRVERNTGTKSVGVRPERVAYVRWFEQTPGVEDLYDHVDDFEQVKNLVSDPNSATVLGDLRKRTTELRDRYGGPYRPNPAAKKK